MKQWGLTPEQIDPAVTARVPVLVDTDNRYFQDQWQGMPRPGYTPLFQEMLAHPNIRVCLQTDARDYLELVRASDEPDAAIQAVRVDGREFCGPVIYTGALDELLDWRFGLLPYRTLRFDFCQYPQKHVQPVGTV
ncbi:MAG: UDP-galactopyranose mutase, partial [Actinomycetia bacterium]|nr:UDP-galactopyranose mutase [Actinomycetes bacterium]